MLARTATPVPSRIAAACRRAFAAAGSLVITGILVQHFLDVAFYCLLYLIRYLFYAHLRCITATLAAVRCLSYRCLLLSTWFL